MSPLLRQYPEALPIAAVAHVALIALLLVGFHIRPPAEPAGGPEREEPVQAFAVDPEEVDAVVQRLEEQERAEAEQRRREAEERQRLEEERRAEEERLARLREQREAEEAAARQAQEEAEQRRREAEAEAERVAQVRREAEAERERLEQAQREAEEAERRRQEEEEARRRAEEEARQAEEERRRAEEEARRQAEEEERRRAEEEARRQAEAEAEAQAAAEREARERELDRLRGQYEAAIRQHVSRNWRMPSGYEAGQTCEVRVTQIPSGDVTDVRILSCEGGTAFRDSVEAAVRRASPLPPAPDPEVFSRNIEFTFRPES